MDIQSMSAAVLSRPGVEHAGLPQMNMPWFESPFFEPLLAEQNVTEEERRRIRAFAEDGYIILDDLIPELDLWAPRIIRDLEPEYKGHRRIHDAWKLQADVKATAVHPHVLEILRFFYQREPIPFQTINFPVGTGQLAHSDTVHFHCVPHRFMCGVWIALEDVDESSGPLFVYPGSHKLPVWNFHDLGLPSGWEHYHEYEEGLQHCIDALALKKKTMPMRKGQALFWAANLIHGGAPILEPQSTRHSQVTHYFFADCLYYTPMSSDPYVGKMQMRHIEDIRTGALIPNMYNGKPIDPPLVQAMAEPGVDAMAHHATMSPPPPTKLSIGRAAKRVVWRTIKRFL